MSKFNFAQSSLSDVPELPGVYLFHDSKSKPIYVGKAKSLKKRLATYFSIPPKYHKVQLIQEKSSFFEIIITSNEHEAFILENQLIKKYQPILNILLKDDKSYPYVAISGHDYPRLFMTRNLDKKNKYYGPYSNVGAVKDTIDHLQRVFKIRSCRDYFFKQRSRPCLQYQINRCSAPCVGYISKTDYAKQISFIDQFLKGDSNAVIAGLQKQMDEASTALNYELAAQLRDQIKRLNYIHNQKEANFSELCQDCFAWHIDKELASIYHVRLLDGQQIDAKNYLFDIDPILDNDEIITQFLVRFYESPTQFNKHSVFLSPMCSNASTLKNQLNSLFKHVVLNETTKTHVKSFLHNAELNRKLALETHNREKNKNQLLQSMMALSEADFNLQGCHIECYDVSHQQGRFTCASCVVFNETGPVKKNYRKYNLTLKTPGDDYEAIYQVIYRRFQKDNPIPDLIIIDGGKGQIKHCVDALEASNRVNYRVIGIAKGPTRKVGLEQFFEYQEGRIRLFSPSDELKHFLLSARDEAHRFAISQTRNKMTKTTIGSNLECIPGVGVMKRRQLLKTFGGLKGLKEASIPEIAQVPGIGPILAEKIYQSLH